MPADSDLIIVSLVRYADSCEPSQRHSDCPFAVERDGHLTCHEECRGVIRTLLRRGRDDQTAGSDGFDARQLRLSEPTSSPDILWHTSSLLQVVMSVARTSPLMRDGSLNLRRFVDATSALAALGSRGLDSDQLVRRGAAKSIRLALAAWLGQPQDRSKDWLNNWEHTEAWRDIFKDGIDSKDSAQEYLKAASGGPVAQRIDDWIATASIEDVLLWKPPSPKMDPRAGELTNDEVEIWAWVIERFTQTYLDQWSLESLKREYSFVQGSWEPDLSTQMLSLRIITREKIATALADRAMVSADLVDPSTMNMFTEQAIDLLAGGQRNAAAALFSAARMLKPADIVAQNNYAFCVLLDKPDEAIELFKECLERGLSQSATTWCNLSLAEYLTTHTVAAMEACQKAYSLAEDSEYAYLWKQSGTDWTAEYINVKSWSVHFGAKLERVLGGVGNIWAERLASLTLLESRAVSEDPSSTETGGEDL